MKKFLIMTALLLSVSTLTIAQNNKFSVSTPDFLLTPKGKQSFQAWAEKQIHNYSSSKSGRVWVVFSDRENNQTYSEPDINSKAHSVLGFRDKLYVADIKKGFALVFSSDIKQNDYPNILSPQWKGWVPIEHLLMWNQCPKNDKQIYNKGIVVYTPGQNSEAKKDTRYLLAPNPNATESSVTSFDLDILYVMKKEVISGKTYFLLSKQNILNPDGRYEYDLLGWLSQDYLTEWDYRLLLEPSYSSAAVNYYKNVSITPSIFQESTNGMNNARTFQRTGKYNTSDPPLWVYDKFSTERMDNYRMRNPIIGNSAELYNVATISTFNQSNGDIEAYLKARKELDELKKAIDQINLIFVIDNTASMRKYYPAVCQSLEKILKQDIKSKLRVGAVLYKDYKDRETVNHKPLTSNINQIIGFLNINKENCNSIDPDDYEALFSGLETALDMQKMGYDEKQSTFIILIGDAGNHRVDPKGIGWEEKTRHLAEKMSLNHVSFLAYQVNNSGGNADRDFGLQIGVLQKEYSQLISKKMGTKTDFKLRSDRFYTLNRVESKNKSSLPIYDSYCYLPTGKSETSTGLESIILNNFNDFHSVVDRNIEALSGTTNGAEKSTGGLQEEVIREILRVMGYSSNKIEQIITMIKEGKVAKFFGWAANKIKDAPYNLFDFVLLFSENELGDLMHNLDKVNSISSNDAQALQDALIAIGQSMIGNFQPNGTVGEMLNQIYGLPIKINTCSKFSFDEIIYLDKDTLERFIHDFNTKLTHLKAIKRNKESSFSQGDLTYYWIRLADMPGVCE